MTAHRPKQRGNTVLPFDFFRIRAIRQTNQWLGDQRFDDDVRITELNPPTREYVTTAESETYWLSEYKVSTDGNTLVFSAEGWRNGEHVVDQFRKFVVVGNTVESSVYYMYTKKPDKPCIDLPTEKFMKQEVRPEDIKLW